MIVTGKQRFDNGMTDHFLECEHCGHKVTVSGPSIAEPDVPRAGCPKCKKTAQQTVESV